MPAEELIVPDDSCLRGTTRTLLQRAADAAAVPWVSRSVSVHDQSLRTSKALFATSAGIGVRPITSIDGHAVTGAPEVAAVLAQAYATLPEDVLT